MTLVSIIVPCYNEQDTITLLLEAIHQQTFAQGQAADMEVIIADGRSTDQTRARVAEFARKHPRLAVRVVENARRNIPAGLNCALAEARGQTIIRLDAHSVPESHYVELCLQNLAEGKGENVGGVWEIRAREDTLMARAIAIAAAHPLGVGDARYRYATQAGYVDTVPFGAFRRATFEKFGGFDETLLTNEDYEFNARLRQNGARVWLDPSIRSTYFARADLPALAKQYARYGFWKWRMLRRYPATLRWRQALPPLMVAGVTGMAGLALFWQPARLLLAGGLLAYFLALATGTLPAARRQRDARLVLAVPLAIAAMHFSWGAGFLWSIFSKPPQALPAA